MEILRHGRGDQEPISFFYRVPDDTSSNETPIEEILSYNCPSDRGDGTCVNGRSCNPDDNCCIKKSNYDVDSKLKTLRYY